MKNLFIATLAFFITIQCDGQKQDFDQFCNENFSHISFPFELNTLLKIDTTKSRASLFETHQIIGNYKKSISTQLHSKPFVGGSFQPLFQIRTIGGIIILAYDRLIPNENGDQIYKCILKSFHLNGQVIDSMVIGELSAYESIITATIGELVDAKNIIVNHSHRFYPEDSQEVVELYVKIRYRVSDSGKFNIVNDGAPYIFKNDFGYSTLKNTLTDFHKQCFQIVYSAVGDVDGDSVPDLVTFLNRDSAKCGGKPTDFLVAMGEPQGAFVFKGTQGGTDINPKEFQVKAVEIKDAKMVVNVERISNKKNAKIYYAFNTKNRLCYLVKAEVISHGKVESTYTDFDKVPIGKTAQALGKIL